MLTVNGENLATYVANGLRSIQIGLEKASDQGEIVRIAILPLFASRWLSPRLGSFWDAYPNTQLSFRSQNNTFAERERPSDFADLGIVWGQGDWADFESICLWPEKMVVVCSPDYLSENPIHEEADLRNRTLLHVDDEARWREWFTNNKLAPPPLRGNWAPQEPHFQISSTINGLGVALIPHSMIQSELESGVLVNLFGCTYATSFAY